MTTHIEPLKIRHTKLKLFASLLLVLGSSASYAADTSKGAKLYATHCATCHGASGINVMPGAPNFTKGESLLQPNSTLLSSIKNGKNAMPAFQGILSDVDIMDVIAHLRTLN